eukprot:5263775-Prymnesium_polylepis.2
MARSILARSIAVGWLRGRSSQSPVGVHCPGPRPHADFCRGQHASSEFGEAKCSYVCIRALLLAHS